MMAEKGKPKETSSLPAEVLERLQSPEYRKKVREDFKRIEKEAEELRAQRRANPINMNVPYLASA